MRIIKNSITATEPPPSNNYSPAVTLLAKLIGSGFGVGYAPVAQGTFGALWIPVLYFVVPWESISVSSALSTVLLPAITIVVYVSGVWAAGLCETWWGIDPGRVVIDEVAGMLVTILFMPLTANTVLLGFLLFRVFDILKPPPIRSVERMHGGFGIMNDDILAGVYANISLRLLLRMTGL